MVIFTVNVKAQIVYTDIPDGQPAGIDFNGDGTNEFDISSENLLGDYITYYNYGMDNNIHAIGDANNAWDVPSFEALNFNINDTNNWIGMGDAYPNGDFANPPGNSSIIAGTDQYMAVRFNLGSTDIYYGWVRVNIDTNGNVTYKDFAYNSTAGEAILAGQMPSNTLESYALQEIAVYPNPAQQIIHIKTKNQNTPDTIIIQELSGRFVKQISINNNNAVDISMLSKGIYLIDIIEKGNILTREKLIVK